MTRKRRYLISAAVLGACIGIALGLVTMLSPRPSATAENFRQIKYGMARSEAAAILGEPIIVGRDFQTWRHHDSALITIGFEGNQSRDTTFTPSTETIPDKLRRWLLLPK